MAWGLVMAGPAYKWVDREGVAHYSDTPPPEIVGEVETFQFAPLPSHGGDPVNDYYSIVNQAQRMQESRLALERERRARWEAEREQEQQRLRQEQERKAREESEPTKARGYPVPVYPLPYSPYPQRWWPVYSHPYWRSHPYYPLPENPHPVSTTPKPTFQLR
ncbi:MAG: DUF4124 domain-containing protein [Deltaproteobacteria bacterium]|nr:DUF4124 domain-containing protein [Deltaproteobacteria bacterium]